MKKTAILLTKAVTLALLSQSSAFSEALCRAPEATLFECEVGNKTVAICRDAAGASQYRYGKSASAIELVVPERPLPLEKFASVEQTPIFVKGAHYSLVDVSLENKKYTYNLTWQEGPTEIATLQVLGPSQKTMSSKQCRPGSIKLDFQALTN